MLTPEQARILYDLVMVNGRILEARWSHGICSGLLDALLWIEAAGGAYVDGERNPLSPPVGVPHLRPSSTIAKSSNLYPPGPLDKS